ncbi:hypothetical protein B0J11DRAFT_529632 [Dendryphion nanum]|uniref:Pal1 cell morphology n=1 Tax=Dendryphion nanum TaxID=256645 RepID=A0A9P9DQX9_9PLEO|nr:hypothetical protein B0J11DRAFT_529632 [Dendryphion nanum]
MGSDKYSSQAQHALIDPLIEPDPSEETGLNSHFRSTFAPAQGTPITPPGSADLKDSPSVNIRHQHTGSSVETNPFRHSRGSSISKGPSTTSHRQVTPNSKYDYPSPPNSASPRRSQFSNHRADAFGSMNQSRPRRSSQPSSFDAPPSKDGGLTRGGSLRERYPGDMSHRPLDSVRKETKTAHRAHHLRKKNFTGADTIDRLDRTGMTYHHEGPYDAANISRNLDWKHSPVAAVKDSNEEALRATPRENIVDAVNKHRPLEGVANIPPGMPDRLGRVLDYEEGADLQREPGGDYRRWPGQKYHPNDLKGKGEPSFSVDKTRRDHKQNGDTGIEMRSRHRNRSLGAADAPESVPLQADHDHDSGLGRSNTTGKSMGNSLKKRFGSLRRKKVEP